MEVDADRCIAPPLTITTLLPTHPLEIHRMGSGPNLGTHLTHHPIATVDQLHFSHKIFPESPSRLIPGPSDWYLLPLSNPPISLTLKTCAWEEHPVGDIFHTSPSSGH